MFYSLIFKDHVHAVINFISKTKSQSMLTAILAFALHRQLTLVDSRSLDWGHCACSHDTQNEYCGGMHDLAQSWEWNVCISLKNRDSPQCGHLAHLEWKIFAHSLQMYSTKLRLRCVFPYYTPWNNNYLMIYWVQKYLQVRNHLNLTSIPLQYLRTVLNSSA